MYYKHFFIITAISFFVVFSAHASTRTDLFYMDALNDVLVEALEGQGVRVPLRIEEVYLNIEGGTTISAREGGRLYGWNKFSLADIQINDRESRFTARMVASRMPTNANKTQLPLDEISVRGRIVSLVEVPVLSETLYNGDIIANQHIEWKELPEKLVRSSVVTDARILVGKTPKQRITSGKMIRIRDVSAPVLINKDDAVTMLYHTNSIELQTVGIALEEGKKGELIRIENAKSKKVVRALVVDQGVVDVNYASNIGATLASNRFDGEVRWNR